MRPIRTRIGGRSRRGYVLLEAGISIVLLSVAMAILVPMLGRIAAARRVSERRGVAIQEAANAMERVSILPYDRLATASAAEVARLSPSAAKLLPSGRIAVEVEETRAGGGPVMKRVVLSVRWRTPADTEEAPVRLVAWVADRRKTP